MNDVFLLPCLKKLSFEDVIVSVLSLFFFLFQIIVSGTPYQETREFKKLRRQLQGKRHIKIEFCVKSVAITPYLSRCAK